MDRLVNVAMVGCGGFALGMHLPNMTANGKYKLYAACDVVEESAKKAAAQFKMEYATTDYDRVLKDPKVDLVVICTRHNLHAPQVIAAAKAGKHILCEKPMGLNEQECREIAKAVRKAGVKYTVGYNRGLAPLIVKAKEMLSPFPQKRLIYHRLQAHFGVNSWTHIPDVGGGRFVGEGCHIFDLLCELVESPPVSVFASGGTFLDPNKVKIPDSGIVTITYEDGSVGTTLIASAGCEAFPKEATEIYCDTKAIYIDLFRELQYYGFAQDGKINLGEVDKGHKAEIDQLADAILKDSEAPNGLAKAARAAIISYRALDSIRTGKPVAISPKDYNL